jgi:hypothetical protein
MFQKVFRMNFVCYVSIFHPLDNYKELLKKIVRIEKIETFLSIKMILKQNVKC